MELTSLGFCIKILKIAQHCYMGPCMLKGVKECEIAIKNTPKCDFHDYKNTFIVKSSSLMFMYFYNHLCQNGINSGSCLIM
jgi:hypothetical protein